MINVEKREISFVVNGEERTASAYPMDRLLDVLRTELVLTGTKEGCGEGECGACSVFLDGRLVNSCLVPAAQVTGAEVTTIEGIATAATELDEVQEAFLEYGGAQCGICTPGMILAAHNLLRVNREPSREDIAEALAGNLCRCTGYTKIFESVVQACKTLGVA